jgi:hypothetical protein
MKDSCTYYGTRFAVGTMAETPPTNTAPRLPPGLRSLTETRVFDCERGPANLSGVERAAEREAPAFFDFIFPCDAVDTV